MTIFSSLINHALFLISIKLTPRQCVMVKESDVVSDLLIDDLGVLRTGDVLIDKYGDCAIVTKVNYWRGDYVYKKLSPITAILRKIS